METWVEGCVTFLVGEDGKLSDRLTFCTFDYEVFLKIRKRLAKDIGINLSLMEGYCCSDLPFRFVMEYLDIPLDDMSEEELEVVKDGGYPWSEVDDDIVPFLDHSDCDGYLTPEECEKVYPRIDSIIDDWMDDEYIWYKVALQNLVKDMKTCVKKGCNLYFS